MLVGNMPLLHPSHDSSSHPSHSLGELDAMEALVLSESRILFRRIYERSTVDRALAADAIEGRDMLERWFMLNA